MNRRTHHYAALAALLLSILTIVPAPSAFTQAPAGRVIEQQPDDRKPIPRSWKIAIAASVAVLIAVAFAFTLRAWRASNLFDREYRFAPVESAALRLGASKSGGCMAAIEFRDRGDPLNEAN